MIRCDYCMREIETKKVKITDEMGVRYRYFCDDCIKRFSQNVQIDVCEPIAEEPKKDSSDKRVTRGVFHNEDGTDPFFVTTTPTLQGYRIVEYKGIVSDEAIYGIGFKTSLKSWGDVFASWTGDEMHAVSDRMNELKTALLESLKGKSRAIGANAIVGLDFENTFPSPNAVMVSANGTAVRIEKAD